jgi:hypothetical protein
VHHQNLHLRTRNFLLAAAALLVATAGFYWHLNGPAPEPTVSASRSVGVAPPPVPANAQQTATDPVVPISAPNTGQPNASQELLQRFNRSQSYRAFVYEAIKHPEWGGLQWAQTVLTQCRRYPLGTVAPATLSAEGAAAMSALVTRCDMSKEENSELSMRLFRNAAERIVNTTRALAFSHPKGDIDPQTLEVHLKGLDPYQNLLSAMMKPGNTADEKAAAITQVLHTGSPSLILHAIQSESSQSAGVNSHKAYFDGTWYTSQANINTLYLAYDLATCELGLDCSANSYRVLSLCASRGFCGDSVASAIRNGVAQREGFRWETIDGLARNLTAAIQQGNALAFIPPQPINKP